MAVERNVTRADDVFNGESKTFTFAAYEKAGATYQANGDVLVGTPKNISGWALSFMVKRNKQDSDAMAKFTKTVGSGVVIQGTFNASQGLNTQRAVASLTKTELATMLSTVTYYYEWKRTDTNVETVLAHGTFSVRQGVHR